MGWRIFRDRRGVRASTIRTDMHHHVASWHKRHPFPHPGSPIGRPLPTDEDFGDDDQLTTFPPAFKLALPSLPSKWF